MMNQ
jgi:hypothetical protein